MVGRVANREAEDSVGLWGDSEKEQRGQQLLTWTLKDRRTFPEGGGGGQRHSLLRKRGEQRLGDKRTKTKQRDQQGRICKCLQFIHF